MKLLLIIYILTIVLIIKSKRKIFKEHFCDDSDEGHLCTFAIIELPIQDEFTNPEIKKFDHKIAEDLYNKLLNTNNPKLSFKNYLKIEGGIEIIDTNEYVVDKNLEKYLMDSCYINTTDEVEGIISNLNFLLKDKYLEQKNYEYFEIIKSSDSVKSYFAKLLSLRYNYFKKLFYEFNNISEDSIDLELIRQNIYYLLLEENKLKYIYNNLRLGVYVYIYDKNIFIISNEIDNNIYQDLLLTVIETIKKYILEFFNITLDEIEKLTINQIRNYILNGKIIDYFQGKKDLNLCYI